MRRMVVWQRREESDDGGEKKHPHTHSHARQGQKAL